jgi:hypothetical protein
VHAVTSSGEETARGREIGVEARLTQEEPPGRCPGVFDLDEELARPTDEGRIAHAVIAKLAAETRRPSLARVQTLVDEQLGQFAPIEARAHRQNIRGVVHRYFSRCLPPSRFIFGGANFDLGVGRPDCLWFDIEQFVLTDEVKTGSPRNLALAKTREQVERYRVACLETFDERFLGIRLLCPAEPSESLLITPDGTTKRLADTPYLQRT